MDPYEALNPAEPSLEYARVSREPAGANGRAQQQIWLNNMPELQQLAVIVPKSTNAANPFVWQSFLGSEEWLQPSSTISPKR